jgi:predicted TIM-barrel fold metal-dependent hydrolase
MAGPSRWIISVDDHIVEPGNVWVDRVPSRMRDAVPHIEKSQDGEAWVFGSKIKPVMNQGGRLFTTESGLRDLIDVPHFYHEMRPGSYDPVERAKDMDRVGVAVSACFPSFPRFCGQEFLETPDRDLGLACVQAYNDWLIDEWAGAAPGRYIPLIILPLWDPPGAAAEIERCAAKGAKGITFPENPHPLGLPSIHDIDLYWDPVFRAAEEASLPLCTHIGSSSRVPRTSPDSPVLVTAAAAGVNAQLTLTDWMFSTVFLRFPKLKLCLSEGGIGWMPYVLERIEFTMERRGEQFSEGTDIGYSGFEYKPGVWDPALMEIPTRQLFKDHVFGCFIDDPHGVDSIDEIGVENVMLECDYPHADSSWPDTNDVVNTQLASLSDADRHLVEHENAERVFNLEPLSTIVG